MTTFGYSHLVRTGDGSAIKCIADRMIENLQLLDKPREEAATGHLMDVLADLYWLAQTSEFEKIIAQIEGLLDRVLASYGQCEHCGSIVSSPDTHHEFPDLCWDCGDAEMVTLETIGKAS